MKVIFEYMEEATLAVIEQAGILARHRKSNAVEAKDIAMVLGN